MALKFLSPISQLVRSASAMPSTSSSMPSCVASAGVLSPKPSCRFVRNISLLIALWSPRHRSTFVSDARPILRLRPGTSADL